VERPTEVVSKRQVVYDDSTYDLLAGKWQAYYDVFPSEDAYANWMYAARYAGWKNYQKLLMAGVEKYPMNPTLLYLAGMRKQKVPSSEADLAYTRRAAKLDPGYMDPWFHLAIEHLARGEMEQLDIALKHLLEGGGISEEVMDYNHNLLTGLAQNAILITNGDNDTYPGWILQRIIGYRPDVRIVNRSLLNTDWYVHHIIDEGVPRFVTTDTLSHIKASIRGPWDEILIKRIISTTRNSGRPVYFSHTLYLSPEIRIIMENGHALGLASLVTPLSGPYSAQVERMAEQWLSVFRTSGFDAWAAQYADPSPARRWLMTNYAHGTISMLKVLGPERSEHTVPLFNWYLDHCFEIISDKQRDKLGAELCQIAGYPEIDSWCLKEGYAH